MLLAIIPARGGSKGIPRKNLIPLGGKPLIEYTIIAAQKSKHIDHILLSTDDDAIAEFGKKMGLDINYRRPQELAADNTSMIDTLEHAVNWFSEHNGQKPLDTMLLQPTSPLRTSLDIDNAVNVYYQTASTSLVSVHEMHEHPYECIKGIGNDAHYLVVPPKETARRQDYDNSYHYINGAIYIANTDFLFSHRSFVKIGKTHFFPISRERGVDIDTPSDLCIADALLKFKTSGGVGACCKDQTC